MLVNIIKNIFFACKQPVLGISGKLA